jgi:predicted ATP-grasp superfamily ATP-dependent carboligase
MDWLLELGRREPGQVLLATSDDLAWLFARERGALARHYRLDVPRLETVYQLLNKWRLRQACAAVGIAVPETWLPSDGADLDRIGREARFPLVIKPQTQVLLSPHLKGQVVRTRHELRSQYDRFCSGAHHHPMLIAQDPAISRPMLQGFAEEAASGIYNLSGFVDVGGNVVALASRKILQRPRLTGVGLCFEEAEVVPEIAEKLAVLCTTLGYHGVFEAEFIRSGGRHLLIDFNPRFFGQMAFDVARGLDLPLLAYLAAVGDGEALGAAIEGGRRAGRTRERRVFCNAFQLELFLQMLRLAGRMSRQDARQWRSWRAENRARVTDPVFSEGDWGPGVVDALSSLVHLARHPRSSWRMARES